MAIVFVVSLPTDEKIGVDSTLSASGAKIHEVPEGLEIITVSGKLKPYDSPSGAPPSDLEPEFVLVTDRNYQEMPGVIQVELYNVRYLPENPEYVQVTGYYNPTNPDWVYPEQTQRTQQVIFVEDLIELKPIETGNEYSTQELQDRYDQIQNNFQNIKNQFNQNQITKGEYITVLEKLVDSELDLYEDAKEHTFERDEMTEYNFWHRGVMKFPTTLEQELSMIRKE